MDDIKQREDEAGVIRSRDYLQSLIAAEVKEGIPSHRIVVGGFSQGGALALLTGATSAPKLGGIFGLSSYLVLHETIRSMIPDGNPNQDTPIFMGHGDRDWVVRYDWGKKTAETLRGWGYKVDFRTYAYVTMYERLPIH